MSIKIFNSSLSISAYPSTFSRRLCSYCLCSYSSGSSSSSTAASSIRNNLIRTAVPTTQGRSRYILPQVASPNSHSRQLHATAALLSNPKPKNKRISQSRRPRVREDRKSRVYSAKSNTSNLRQRKEFRLGLPRVDRQSDVRKDKKHTAPTSRSRLATVKSISPKSTNFRPNSSTTSITTRRTNDDPYDFSRSEFFDNASSSADGNKTKSNQEQRAMNSFSSPPLLPGLLKSLKDVLGESAKPTTIQKLSLASIEQTSRLLQGNNHRQYLLASETGSGKSLAYILPLIQHLKRTELEAEADYFSSSQKSRRRTPINPRALILAPTHELCRQLSGMVKSMAHYEKVRVWCASRRNLPTDPGKGDAVSVNRGPSGGSTRSGGGRGATARKMKEVVDTMLESSALKREDKGGSADIERRESMREDKEANTDSEWEEIIIRPDGSQGHIDAATEPSQYTGVEGARRDIDIVVSTPRKVLELLRGDGWEKGAELASLPFEERKSKDRWIVGRKLMSLHRLEWVVLDEADVLFDRDFVDMTEDLLTEASLARGGDPVSSSTADTQSTGSDNPQGLMKSLPFNLSLVTATLPASLSSYISTNLPNLIRLVSPNLHKVPKSVDVEWVEWSGGNKNADVLREVKRVWGEDVKLRMSHDNGEDKRSKILIFTNKSTRAGEVGKYLNDVGVGNVVLTSKISSDTSTDEKEGAEAIEEQKEDKNTKARSELRGSRRRGSNKHLSTFLRPHSSRVTALALREQLPLTSPSSQHRLRPSIETGNAADGIKEDPHILITTSLLSRGLDFSPNVRYVFMLDPPRNGIDFLHRAGRVGRMGPNNGVKTLGVVSKDGRSWGKVLMFGKKSGRGGMRGKRDWEKARVLV